MNITRQKYKLLIVIAALIPMLLGLSYAYFAGNKTGNPINLSGNVTNNLAVSLNIDNNRIVASEIYPIIYEDVATDAPSTTFSVVNNSNKEVFYTLSFVNIDFGLTNVDRLKTTDFRWRLVCNNHPEKNAEGSFAKIGDATTIQLKSNVISANSTDQYTIYVYLEESEEDQTALMGGSFASKIQLDVNYLNINQIPSTYTPLDYITSSSGETINTGYVHNTKPKIETAIKANTTNRWIFLGNSLFENGQNISDRFAARFDSSSNLLFTYGDAGGSFITNINSSTWTHISYNDVWLENGVRKFRVNNYDFSSNEAPIILFSAGNGTIYMKTVRIWDGGTLVRNMIPCERNSDGTPGMYDTIEHVFYPLQS